MVALIIVGTPLRGTSGISGGQRVCKAGPVARALQRSFPMIMEFFDTASFTAYMKP